MYYQYYSQFKQDEFLHKNIFKEKKHGFFVDIGAHDGITGNNTIFFENEMEWSGICCEPLPNIYSQLQNNRKSINLKCAVDTSDGTTDFYENEGYTEMLSGIVSHYDHRHIERRNREILAFGGNSKVIQVRTLRLETIFDIFGVNHIDYLSIDVEGGEFAVIQSINFDKVFIDIIDFEDNYSDVSEDIKKYLNSKGYLFMARLGGDIIMIHKYSKYISLK
jgi:FkbM family methyltransferase